MLQLQKSYFLFVFAINILIYGLVYLYPLNEYGEPQIPIFFKLFLDFLLLGVYLFFGFKNSFNLPQILYLGFLSLVLIIGAFHIWHTSIEEYLHFSIRNVFFYSLFFFVNPFKIVSTAQFDKFHQALFHWVLYGGLVLFALQKLGIPNPFGFDWMWEKNRLISTWLNPNSLGFYLMFYLFYYYHRLKKINLKILLIVLSIFLTGSITAILGVALSSLWLIFNYLSGMKFKGVHAILIILIIPCALYFAFYFGAFDYIWFKIDVLFIQKDETYTSVSARVQNLIDLYNFIRLDNLLSILFGDFNTLEYRRLDGQYFNVFYNYGLSTLLVYIGALVAIMYDLTKLRSPYARPFLFFNIWLFFVAFNLTAYLYRPNLVVFYFIIYQFIRGTKYLDEKSISVSHELRSERPFHGKV